MVHCLKRFDTVYHPEVNELTMRFVENSNEVIVWSAPAKIALERVYQMHDSIAKFMATGESMLDLDKLAKKHCC
jgi:hypothetical protein